MANELSKDDLRRFARLGAMRRLDDIRREEAAIRTAFPELFTEDSPRRGGAAPGRTAKKAATSPKRAKAAKAASGGARPRKRSTMSPAMRQEVSERMKKYWAGRRKAKNA